MNNKKVYAVLSAAAIGTIFSVAINTSVKADTRDFTNIKTQKVYKAADWRADDALFDELVDELTNNPDDYVVEFTGNQYVYDGLLNALINNVPFNEALQDPSLIYTPETPALEVNSVSASTTTILPSASVDVDKYQLALKYMDADGNEIAADQLPADLTVSYVDNKDVFNADGTIKAKDKIPAVSGTIKVVATVTSESAGINLTKEFTVTVVNPTDWASVTDTKLVFNTDVTGSVAVVGDTIGIVPTVATQNNGTELSGDTAPVDWGTQVKSVKSSDITKISVAKSGSGINLTPISEGSATITVTLNSGYIYTKTIEAEEAARVATVGTPADTTVTLSSTVTSNTVKVTVVDQYGDPVKGATLYAYPAKTGADAIILANSSATTNKNGEATLTLNKAASAKTGADTVKLSVDSDPTKAGIGTVGVEYAQAGDVASYELRVSANSKSTDASIDTYDTDDNALELEFISKDANGVIANVYNQTDVGVTYSVTSSDAEVATVAIDASGKIDVTPVKAGTTTVIVKEGNIVRATYKVTVTDSTPSVGEISLKAGSKIYINSGKTDSTDNVTISDALGTFYTNQVISNLIEVKSSEKTFTLAYDSTNKDFDVKDGTNIIANVKLFTSDATNLVLNADGQTIEPGDDVTEGSEASIIAKLIQGTTTVGTVAIPVVFDETAPTAPTVAGKSSGLSDNIINATEAANGQVVRVSFTDAEVGDVVAVDPDENANAGDIGVTLTSQDVTNGYVDVTIPAGTYQAADDDSTVNIATTLTDKANNAVSAATYDVKVDLTAPTITGLDTSDSVTGFVSDEPLYLNGVALEDNADVSSLLSETSVGQEISSAIYTTVGNTITVTLDGSALNGEKVLLDATGLTDKAGNPVGNQSITTDGSNWTLD